MGRLLFIFIEMMILRRQIHSNNTTNVKWEQGYKYRATSLHDYPDRDGKRYTTNWKLLTHKYEGKLIRARHRNS